MTEYVDRNLNFRDVDHEFIGGSFAEHTSDNPTYFVIEPSITYTEVVLMVNFAGLETEYQVEDIWATLIIPMPQYLTQNAIRLSYLQNGNNYGYADFTNTGFHIILNTVFYKGVQYSSTVNADMFKKVKWKAIPRYTL